MFRIVRIYYKKFDDNSIFRLKIFWHIAYGDGKKEKKIEKKTEKKTKIDDISEKTSTINKTTTKINEQAEKISEKDKDTEKDKSGFIVKIKQIFSKIKGIISYPNATDIVKYTLQLIIEELIAIKPSVFRIKGIIGFDDPSLTGYSIGLISVIRGVTDFDIDILGNFNESEFALEGSAMGKTSFWDLLLPLIRWSLKDPIWEIIKPIFFDKNKDKNKDRKDDKK